MTGGRVARLIEWLRHEERLLAICGSTVLVMAGQGVTAPVLPLFAADFGVSAFLVSLTATSFGLARMLLNVPMGMLADRRGRRILLIGGPIVTAVGMIGSGLSPDIWVLLGWRFVAGAGSAMYMTGAQIYLIDIAAPEVRGRYIATNQGALLFGVSIGPGIGGLLAEVWGPRVPFIVVGIMALSAGVYSWYRLTETLGSVRERPATADEAAANRKETIGFLLSPAFIAVSLVAFAIFVTRAGGRGVLVALRGSDAFGMGEGALGVVFTLTGVIGLILIAPAGIVVDRYGPKVAIVPAGFIAGAGSVLAGLGSTAAIFIAGTVVMAIGTSISGPAPASFVASIAPERLRGVAMGWYRTAGDVGFVLGPPVLGFVADRWSLSVGLVVNGVLLAATAAWFLVRIGGSVTSPHAADTR